MSFQAAARRKRDRTSVQSSPRTRRRINQARSEPGSAESRAKADLQPLSPERCDPEASRVVR